MNDEQRRLLLARETWREVQPGEAEVLRAAQRIVAKIPPRKSLGFGRQIRMVSGALATVAGIAYAGSGGFSEITGHFGRGRGPRPNSEEQTVAALAGTTPAVEKRTAGPRDPKEERVGVPLERLALAEPPLAAPAESAAKPKRRLGRAVAPRARHAAPAQEILVSIDRVDPTWADVNAALAALDYKHAEALLLTLTGGTHDADTRAKAHLGLAQLAASRGDCERARVLALGVAAAPGIEMKTVRRALELAVRCAR